jgi:hypothetical protein
VADGNLDSAIKHSQAHFALARNVGDGPTIANVLVGFAIQGNACSALTDFIQHPQAPNLYWSIAALPKPLISLDKVQDAELHSLELTFPWLKNVLDEQASADQWNERLDQVWELMSSVGSRVPVTLNELIVWGYPTAKRRLVDQGQTSERVSGMSVAQVLLADMYFQDQIKRQSVLKWSVLPFVRGYSEVMAAQDIREEALGFDLEHLASRGRFEYSNALVGQVSSQQKLAMLQFVEVLRMVAAGTGALPKSIADVSYPPLPIDPASGEPFQFESDGTKATLEGSPFRYLNTEKLIERWEIELLSNENPEE